jgi:hypothetical protein
MRLCHALQVASLQLAPRTVTVSKARQLQRHQRSEAATRKALPGTTWLVGYTPSPRRGIGIDLFLARPNSGSRELAVAGLLPVISEAALSQRHRH